MVKATRDSAPACDAVMNSLRIQGIAFRGPFCAPSKRILFVVESYVFLESELVDLLTKNKLNRDGIEELAKRLAAHSRTPGVST
jgi:hypothetical protein